MPSNDELMEVQAAKERLRRLVDYGGDCSNWKVYPGDSLAGRHMDEQIATAAFLAQPDDTTLATEQAGEQAIDEAWLREIGFFVNKHDSGILYLEAGDLLVEYWLDSIVRDEGVRIFDDSGNSMPLFTITTRRQLLSLLTALGIEVKQ